MKSLFLFLAGFTFTFYSVYGIHNASPKKTLKNSLSITGTYSESGFILKLKKNHKVKISRPAPRPLVYKGNWEIKNDTLICTMRHCNTNLETHGKNMEKNPMIYKYIIRNGELCWLNEKESACMKKK